MGAPPASGGSKGSTAPPPSAGRPATPRARARAAVVEEIKGAARAQLAERGAAALSVRHVARELGMSSSGMYRYFASRDELLTALIIDAYNHLGEAVELADGVRRPHGPLRAVVGGGERGSRLGEGPPPGVRARLRLAGPRLRRPARHRRPALPASPSPSPRSSATPGTRRVAAASGETAATGVDLALSEAVEPLIGLPADVVANGILAWVELFGFVSFELFGHLVGSVDDGDTFFRLVCERVAADDGHRGRRTAGVRISRAQLGAALSSARRGAGAARPRLASAHHRSNAVGSRGWLQWKPWANSQPIDATISWRRGVLTPSATTRRPIAWLMSRIARTTGDRALRERRAAR